VQKGQSIGELRKKRGPNAMAEKSHNLQDTFLNHVRKAKIPLTIFLVNGVKLQGVVTWFDNFCLLLRRDGQSQLVYKHAISTVMPSHPVQLFEPEAEEASDND
jgi:host factor-I protein